MKILCALCVTVLIGLPASAATKREAVAKAILLIEKTAGVYIKKRDCFTCHHQALPLMALSRAKQFGFKVNEKVIKAQTEFTLEYFADRQDRLPKGQGVVGGPYTAGYALAGLRATNLRPNETSNALIAYLQKTQNQDGSWRIRTHRPPLEDSHFTATTLAVQSLPSKSAERKRALQWLEKAEPQSTEDRVFQILGLGSEFKAALGLAVKLLATQKNDGGFAQLSEMESDAYATGQALVALRAVGGIKEFEPAKQRAEQWLLNHQKPDGSWHVKTRSHPIQKYFESGFPHGKDQFISLSATCWAVLALAEK